MQDDSDRIWAADCMKQLRVLCAWADEDEAAHMVDAMTTIARFRRMDPGRAATLFVLEAGLLVEDKDLSIKPARDRHSAVPSAK